MTATAFGGSAVPDKEYSTPVPSGKGKKMEPYSTGRERGRRKGEI